MPDIGDIASDYEERMRRDSLARRQAKTSDKPSRLYCLDCDGGIPAGRREAIPGVQYCVECAVFHPS